MELESSWEGWGEKLNPKAGLVPLVQLLPLHPITGMGPITDRLSAAAAHPALQACLQPPPLPISL